MPDAQLVLDHLMTQVQQLSFDLAVARAEIDELRAETADKAKEASQETEVDEGGELA